MRATALATGYDNRKAFADELIELARTDARIVAVCNDSVGSSNLNGFKAEFPDRLINVGIAEQNMVGVGAGLASAGLVPFVCGAGPFLTGRALEQIKADVAYSQHPVILCGMSPGMAYGELGPTHHSVEDFSWLREVVTTHARLTGSTVASSVLSDWPRRSAQFTKIMPTDYQRVMEATLVAKREGRDVDTAIMESSRG